MKPARAASILAVAFGFEFGDRDGTLWCIDPTRVHASGISNGGLMSLRLACDAPDLVWLADITSVPTWAGFLSLAVVLDARSRRIVR